MAGRIEGRTAVVTGGCSGIGLATARRFIAEGARVAITGRKQDTLDAARAELGERLLAIPADTTDEAALARAVAATVKEFGPVHALFANAGIAGGTPERLAGHLREEIARHAALVRAAGVRID